MIKKETTNTFNKGLLMDINPLVTPNNVLTNALNATFVTMNGNEQVLQNDKGNVEVITESGIKAQLPEGYIPVGMKEYGGIIYVASVRPSDGMCQIGSFPSPQYVYGNKMFSDIAINFYKDQSQGSNYFIDTVKTEKEIARSLTYLIIPGCTTNEEKLQYYKELWSELGINITGVSQYGLTIVTIYIPTLINQYIYYPLFVYDGEQIKLKPGDLLNIVSQELATTNSSNVIQAIKDGYISFNWVVRTTYSGQYTLSTLDQFSNSLIPGIGLTDQDSWYYKEPSSSLLLKVLFNIQSPIISVRKYTYKIEYIAESKNNEKLSSIIIKDQYGAYIPMIYDNQSKNFTLSVDKENLTKSYTIEAFPVNEYAGMIPQGKISILINPSYEINSINQWRYKYSNNVAEFVFQYSDDSGEALKAINIQLIDLSTLTYDQIVQMTPDTLSEYSSSKDLEFEVNAPSTIQGNIDNLNDGHLYLVVLQKTIQSESRDDTKFNIGYRFLYACSYYNQFYDRYLDYNNITQKDLQITNNEIIQKFSISQEASSIRTLKKEDRYYNCNSSNSWSSYSETLGNWDIELQDSSVTKKINQAIFDTKIYISGSLNVSDSALDNLRNTYGGTYNKDQIQLNFSNSFSETYDIYSTCTITSSNLTSGQDTPANEDSVICDKLKSLDNISKRVIIQNDANEGIYLSISGISQSFGFSISPNDINYTTLQRDSTALGTIKNRYVYAVLYTNSSGSRTEIVSSEYTDTPVNWNTFISEQGGYDLLRQNISGKNVIGTTNYSEHNVGTGDLAPMYLAFVYDDDGNIQQLKVNNIDNVLTGVENNIIPGGKFLLLLDYMRGMERLWPVILDDTGSSSTLNISDNANNTWSLLTENYYVPGKSVSGTFKSPTSLDNILRYTKQNVTLDDPTKYKITYTINQYHIQDQTTPMSTIFSTVSSNFNITNLSTNIQLESIYDSNSDINFSNLNTNFSQLINEYNTKSYKYWNVPDECNLFAPNVTNPNSISHQEGIINDDQIVKDHLNNVSGTVHGYTFIPSNNANTAVRKEMKSIINPSLVYDLRQVFTTSTSLTDIDIDYNWVSVPTVYSNTINVKYNNSNQGLVTRNWDTIDFLKFPDLYIEGLTPITK